MMVAQVMLGHDYKPGMGLGKNNGGRTSLVRPEETAGSLG